jgi:ClpP class serine protease
MGPQENSQRRADMSYTARSSEEELAVMRQRRVAILGELEGLRDSTAFVYWSVENLDRADADTIFDLLEKENPTGNIDLLLLSPGGSGESAFRIGRVMQQWAGRVNGKFCVLVPDYAKSAATLLALGAHTIVMGLSSELGPIDPQIPKFDHNFGRWRYYPALALRDALNVASEYSSDAPEMMRLFQALLERAGVDFTDLGEVERARETPKQYATTLLRGAMFEGDAERAKKAAEILVDHYKAHGYPIDREEAEETIGLNIADASAEEWELMKNLRDEFRKFVDNPRLIPGVLVRTAFETARNRSWRTLPLSQGSEQARFTLSFPL